MIDWFNQNNGFVTAILTTVYVVATLLMLRAMAASNRLAERAIQHSQELHFQQTRPYVVFDIVNRDRCIYAELQNYGSMPALDVHVSLEPMPKNVSGKGTSTLLRHQIGMLAPGRVLTDFLDVGHQFHEKNPLTFSGTVAYRDAMGNTYSEPFSLDLQYYKEISEIVKKDVGQELQDVVKSLETISRALNALHKS